MYFNEFINTILKWSTSKFLIRHLLTALFKKGKKLREVISVCYLSNLVEFSTFFAGQRVAKASTGLIPLPFLITISIRL